MSEPKKTIYINNLNEKVSINKLKSELLKIFKPYGKILEINAIKTLRLKGQAFITFEEIESATKALEKTGIEIFNKPIMISYAKLNSDIVESQDSINKRKSNKVSTTTIKKKRKVDSKEIQNIKKKRLEILNEWKQLPPNHILLIQNVKKFEDLEKIFNDFNGFENIRLVKVKNLAFIEFENEEMASNCLEQINDEQLNKFGPEDEVILSFAKK